MIRSEFLITGMDCASCAVSIESFVRKMGGVKNASVNYASKMLVAEHEPSLSKEEIIDGVKKLGYEAISTASREGHAEFVVSGMDNDHCVMVVSKAVNSLPGIKSLNASSQTSKLVVDFDPLKNKIEDISKVILESGYEPHLIGEEDVLTQKERLEKESMKKLKSKVLVSAVFSLPILYIAMSDIFSLPVPSILSRESNPIVFSILQLLLSIPIIIAGEKFYTKGLLNLVKRRPNMDSLIGLGTLAAYIYSSFGVIQILFGRVEWAGQLYFETAGVIITLILFGKYLEELTKGRTSHAVKKLIKLQAKQARVLRKGKQVMIPIEQVVVGDIVIVKPGEKIPVDGVVVKGHSSVDESIVTGESIPVEKTRNSKVIGASINKHGLIEFRATRVGRDTMLSQIIKMVEDAQSTKAPIQRLADQVSGVFVPVVIVIALFSAIVWLVLGSLGMVSFDSGVIAFSLTSAITVLVIACPCALGLATPTAIMVGTGKGAEHGILIKSAVALENFGKVKSIILDKTGTITIGKPIVTDIAAFSDFSEESVLSYSASAEKGSEHPLGDAIVEHAKEKKAKLFSVKNFKAIPGHGIFCVVRGKKVLLGNNKLMDDEKIKIDLEIRKEFKRLSLEGKTVMFLAVNRKITGLIGVRDEIRKTSKDAISELQKIGIEVIMITGDNEETAGAISREAGIKKYLAGVLPENKASEVKKIQKNGAKVAMVGDGINDAPALAQSDVGIAIGAGTDVAIESAQIILVKNDLMDVVNAYSLSRATMKNIKQNLFWAFAYNSAGIPVAAGVLYPFLGLTLSPIIAAGAMSFSSISVLLNSLRLRLFKIKA